MHAVAVAKLLHQITQAVERALKPSDQIELFPGVEQTLKGIPGI